MKTILFTLICCVFMSYAIVPMSVGNKWYYYCKTKRELPDTLIYRQTTVVTKDTIDNDISKKKVQYFFNVPLDSIIFHSTHWHFGTSPKTSDLWYENGNKFYMDQAIYYNDGACDSIWDDNGLYTSRKTDFDTIFCRSYTVQYLNSNCGGNVYSWWGSATAKNLGIISENGGGHSTVVPINGSSSKILVAALIDGVYYGDSLATTSIYEQTTQNKSQILAYNYPNPFNNSTTINYTLPQNGFTRLEILNSKGELVKTLNSAMQEAGSHQVTFDATGLNSGIYFYRLNCNGMATVNKMLLVK